VPEAPAIADGDRDLQEHVAATLRRVVDTVDLVSLPETIKTFLLIADRLNTHYNDVEPWKLVKDDTQRNRFLSVCYVMLDCLQMYFRAFYPIIPETAGKALESIGLDAESCCKGTSFVPGNLQPGLPLGDIQNLFPRIE
jgi:methionyl-tRNA synthetase